MGGDLEMKNLTVGVLLLLVLTTSRDLFGQDLFGDLIREAVDENRLNQDYNRLQQDAASGNVVGEMFDVMRIQQDKANLYRDEQRLNYDLNGGGYYSNGGGNYISNGLIASPTNPGYYYYQNNPGQLYYYPNQQNGGVAPQVRTNVAPNAVPARQVNAPANAVPLVLQSVKLINPASFGVDLTFVFGGKTFTVESGQTKEYSISAPTLIVFNRGGELGEARFTLSGDNAYEFKYDENGWSLVQKRREQAIAKAPAPGGLPANPVPRTVAAVNSQPVPQVIPASPAPLPPQ